MQPATSSFTSRTTIKEDRPVTVQDILSARTRLPGETIADALAKGAVWLIRGKKKNRIRNGAEALKQGDTLELNYDPRVLALVRAQPHLIADRKDYTVWFKPAGLLAQGSPHGDHCSLLRLAELHFKGRRQVFLVHRLDREAAGLMLIAHSGKAAAKLSALFRDNTITKEYRIEVRGDLRPKGQNGRIELPLDGKPAVTDYTVEDYDQTANVSTVFVTIRTGRTHQIRRHFEMIGHPVMGDPKYGKGNKNKEGLKLTAAGLQFKCPFSRRDVRFTV